MHLERAPHVHIPNDEHTIILFVTEEKQESQEQYADRLTERVLKWEGPNDHFAEQRMLNAGTSGEEIHLFYRDRHHMDFTYLGRVAVTSHNLHGNRPSEFTLKLTD